MKRFLKGFTLAETMIVIVVLGIIATLTIPALVNKNKESVAKTKLKKAMAAYESALNKMIIENDLKSDDTLAAWAGDAENNCANSTNYFKKVQGDGCIFKTSDGIWWDISNIERPLIAFKDADLTPEKANAENDYSAFALVGRFGTDGSLRVDDLGYETGHDYEGSLAQVQKLYNFLSGKKSSGNICNGECKIKKYKETPCSYLGGEECSDCFACSRQGTSMYDGKTWVMIYDENGQIIYDKSECDDNYENCEWVGTYFVMGENGNIQKLNKECDGDSENCTEVIEYEYDSNNNIIVEKSNYFVDDQVYINTMYNRYDEKGNKIYTYFTCSENDDAICNHSILYEYDSNNNLIGLKRYCDQDGNNCEVVCTYNSSGEENCEWDM